MNMQIKSIGCWLIHTWTYRNRSKLHEIMIALVISNAERYGQFELGKMWAELKEFQAEQIASGVKDTVMIKRQRGATNGPTGNADHYCLYLRDKKRGSTFLCISEPIGTEAIRPAVPELKAQTFGVKDFDIYQQEILDFITGCLHKYDQYQLPELHNAVKRYIAQMVWVEGDKIKITSEYAAQRHPETKQPCHYEIHLKGEKEETFISISEPVGTQNVNFKK